MIQKLIYFLIFIFAIVSFTASDLFNTVMLGLNNLFSSAGGALSGIIAPEAMVIVPLMALVVVAGFISIWRD